MSEKTASKPASDRRKSANGQAGPDRRRLCAEQQAAGLDLPVFGHVAYKSLGFWAGLGAAGAVGVIEWPVVAAVGAGYALARR